MVFRKEIYTLVRENKNRLVLKGVQREIDK